MSTILCIWCIQITLLCIFHLIKLFVTEVILYPFVKIPYCFYHIEQEGIQIKISNGSMVPFSDWFDLLCLPSKSYFDLCKGTVTESPEVCRLCEQRLNVVFFFKLSLTLFVFSIGENQLACLSGIMGVLHIRRF